MSDNSKSLMIADVLQTLLSAHNVKSKETLQVAAHTLALLALDGCEDDPFLDTVIRRTEEKLWQIQTTN